MSWPEGWKRQDIGEFPGATDGTQNVWIDNGQIKTYTPANVPVKMISVLLAQVEDEPETAMHPAWVITWTESERGWGQRPDGISLHETKGKGADYVEAYWAQEKMRNDAAGGGTPDEYERPDSEGKRVLVSTALMERIKAGTHGIRMNRHDETQLTSSGEIKP